MQKIEWPLAAIESLEDLKDSTRLIILNAVTGYAIHGRAVIPAEAAESALPLIRMIIHATEGSIEHHLAKGVIASRSAQSRWRNMSDAEQEPVDVPRIVAPPCMKDYSIMRGGVIITVEEILRVSALFLKRGFLSSEVPHFFSHWGRNKWGEGTIVGSDSRWNRAQRWKQLDGPGRFETDAPAKILFISLLEILPENKRWYMLSDSVSICINSERQVHLSLPKEIHDCITNNANAKAALGDYFKAHKVSNQTVVLVQVPFSHSLIKL